MKYVADWKSFLNEQMEDVLEEDFLADCVVFYDSDKRKQKHILNDIRKISGVTIVSIEEPSQPRGLLSIVRVSVRYDPPPGTKVEAYKYILKRAMIGVRGIEGVRILGTAKVKI